MNKLKSKKTYIFWIIDGICVLVVFILLRNISYTAEKIRTIRTEIFKSNPVNPDTVKNELSKLSEDKKNMINIFPDENRIIDFINQIDEIKKGGILVSFSFANQSIVKDKTGSLGFPISLTLKGNISDVNQTLQEINNLPFLVRPVNFKLNIDGEASQSATVNYGGFIYVNDKFKN